MQNPPRVTSSGTAEIGAPPEGRRAPASIAPVGLEMADTELLEEAPVRPAAMQTGSIRVPPRRRLGGIVIGTVAGCGLILVAAVVARVSHASSAGHETGGGLGAIGATAMPATSPAASPASPRS
ncbi:MAG: hypothetical protein JOZ69_18530, partial [Myxococcales bacterium]|nr:hypothetical protein [Myxococcales bacterium]